MLFSYEDLIHEFLAVWLWKMNRFFIKTGRVPGFNSCPKPYKLVCIFTIGIERSVAVTQSDTYYP